MRFHLRLESELIPKLKHWPETRRNRVLEELQGVFRECDEFVVFADLNLKLNLLWVSMRQHPMGCVGLAAVIKERVPEAMLIANRAEAQVGLAATSPPRRWAWGRRLLGIKR
ncbi:MAG: hypothetical protein GY703_21525 [Gammaproteobacteria bacterium]|nr:hypothetical protein [Gammaproteobacteria bacterium]